MDIIKGQVNVNLKIAHKANIEMVHVKIAIVLVKNALKELKKIALNVLLDTNYKMTTAVYSKTVY